MTDSGPPNGWRKLLHNAGLLGLIGLGVVAGRNIAKIDELDRKLLSMEQQTVQVAVLVSQVQELSSKIEQMQGVLIEMRSAMIRKGAIP